MRDARRDKTKRMKKINTGELFEHLGEFLSAKGIELKEGAYSKRIQQGCEVLTSFINVSQAGLERAKTETGRKLDQVRQVIHEKTAPKPPPAPAPQAQPAPSPKKPAPRAARTAKPKQARAKKSVKARR